METAPAGLSWRLAEVFAKSSSKGCLPLLYKKPVSLEPPYHGDSLPRYNRNPKEICVLKAFTSPFDEVNPENSELLINRLRGLNEPASFEIVGTHTHITIQLVVQKRDRRIVMQTLDSVFPEAYLKESGDPLYTHFRALSDKKKGSGKTFEFHFNEYYLPPPFYFPIRIFSKDFVGDPLDSLISIFSQLEPDELGFYQVIFVPAKENWAELARGILGYRVQETRPVMVKDYTNYNSYRGEYGTKIEDRPIGEKYHPCLPHSELAFHMEKVRQKMGDGKPFFAVVMRAGLFAYKGKSLGLLKGLRTALNILAPGDRQFRFLTREDYYKAGIPQRLHYYMLFNRVSLRPGMLLTSAELSGLAHLPTKDILKKGYLVDIAKGRRPAPEFLTSGKDGGIIIGDNIFKGNSKKVILGHKDRKAHAHIIGITGKGKSTLIANCALQDIQNGTGVCVIEPHGDLIDTNIAPNIPSRFKDRVIYFDPIRNPIGLNILEIQNNKEKDVIASDVVSIFKRHSDNWGEQIDEILSFGVLTILSSSEGGHLGTLHKFLSEHDFRKEYLKTVNDEFVVQFWEKQFPKFPRGAAGPVLRRLNKFLRTPVLREIVSQEKTSFDFREIMDEGKALLVKLPLGEIGESNAYLLGSLIVSRLQAAAFSRVDTPEEERKPFYLYIDEFQNFITRSITDCLTGTRKFALGLVLAHHTTQQMWSRDRDVADTVLSLPRIRICFQVGDEDASLLAKGLAHYTADDLKNLDVGETIVRVGGPANNFEMKTSKEPPLKEIDAKEEGTEEDEGTTLIAGAIAKSDKETTETVIPLKPAVTAKESLDIKKEDAVYRKKETEKQGAISVTQDERKFLEFLANLDELLPVREVYKRVGVGASKGDLLKNTLLNKTLIAEIETSLGKAKRKSKMLVLTQRGYQVLCLPMPSGKGGPHHKHLQEMVARHAKARGFEAVIEEQASNGKLVDVGLSKDGEKIAVEVSITTRPDQVLNNIELDLAGGYNRVIVICADVESLSKTKNAIVEGLNQEKYQKIRFLLANEFEKEL